MDLKLPIDLQELKKAAQEHIDNYSRLAKVWQEIYQSVNNMDMLGVQNEIVVGHNILNQMSKEISDKMHLPEIKETGYINTWPLSEKATYYAKKLNRSFSKNEFEAFILSTEGREVGSF